MRPAKRLGLSSLVEIDEEAPERDEAEHDSLYQMGVDAIFTTN
jgi:hypothetical protein